MFKPEYLLIGFALLLVLAFVQYRSLSGNPLWIPDQTVYRETPSPAETCDEHALGEIDYKVYRALLPQEVAESDQLHSTILVTETVAYSEGNERVGDLIGQGWTSSKSAAASFTRHSADMSPLDREQFQDLSIVLASDAEIDKVFANGIYEGWELLGHVPIVRFSRVGFNCERDQAIVYKSVSCGGLCGHGTLFLLEKKAGEWAVLNQLALWVS